MAHAEPVSPVHPTDRLVGNAPALQVLRTQIRHLAAFDTVGSAFVPTLLLQGETGTGKGLLARVIHDSGPRAQGPFIDVNCAAIPETLLEVELFGFEAGTFTDAKRAKPGLLESALHGTLFLDEIDALPLPLQAKLLSVIEEKYVRRLGAVRSRQLDIKFVAATAAALRGRVAEGRFRGGLYHRLAVVLLEIPPLRERAEDAVLLAQHCLRRYAEAHGLVPKRLSQDAKRWLQEYGWPGNVRELSHLMERMTLLCPEASVSASTLELLCLPQRQPITGPGASPVHTGVEPLDESARIRQVLGQTGGNVVRAAYLLGISRGALRYRMRQYGIGRPRFPLSGPGLGEETGEGMVASVPPLPTFLQQRRGRAEIQYQGEGWAAEAWEQKPVAVLAIDMAWPEDADPQALPTEPWTVTARWEEIIAAKVKGFGGLILQCSPALLTAVFGLPQTLEQLQQRAVQAALAIRHQWMEDKAPDGKPPGPAVRMAVHVGQVLVDVQARDPTSRLLPLGETLSLPVRLLGHALPGDILLSPPVGRLVGGWFEVQVREGAAGGEISDGVGAYAVVGVGAKLSPLEAYGKRPLSRFVGRERELAILHDPLAPVGKGQGQVVGIVGEPGVGKSRLCYEVTQIQRSHGWLILESSPTAYGRETPYLPVIDLLKAYFQLDTYDEQRTVRDKVTGKLQTLDEGLPPTLPALLALLDVPIEDPQWQALDPSQRRQHTLTALKRLWLRESQIQPVLLVVENLHWIDSETQSFLDSLVDSLPTARFLLLVNYRPEYQHGWGSKTYYTQLRLDPLSPEHAEVLLRDLLGENPGLALLKRHLIERSAGNPFFLEESVRTLVETQALVGEPAAYRLGQVQPTLQVPGTVQGVLAARIDRLSPETKRLLQTAAVIGTEVPVPLLQAIAERSEESLQHSLAYLQAAEFLYETRLFPEREYTFKHALTHEVAYGSLLQEQRRTLHARIVDAMETHYVGRMADQVERLAHHAVRGQVWDKALVYCRQAGAKAATHSAYRESVGYFEQGLSALQYLPETHDAREQAIDLRLALRSALFPSGDWGRILAVLRDAESLAAALDDPHRLAQVSLFISRHFSRSGAHDQAIVAAQRTLTLATVSKEATLQAQANYYLGLSYRTQGNYLRAIDCFSRTVAFLDGVRPDESFGQALLPAVSSRAYLAECHAELGTFAEGQSLGEEGLRIAEAVAHRGSLIFAYRGVGLLALRQGDLRRAVPSLEQAAGSCREAGFQAWFPWMAAALGAVYTLGGRLAEAVSLLTQAVEQTTAPETEAFQAFCTLSLGEAQMLAGRLQEAQSLGERALAIACTHQERGHQAYALHLLGNIAGRPAPPNVEEAAAHNREALTLAEELSMRPLQAHCHYHLATLYAKTGRREQAHAELTAAIALYRAMDMTFWLPQAKAALAQLDAVG